MDEFKAKGAEELYRESIRDINQETYALVYIKDGLAVLKDVILDGVPIKEMVKEKNE